MKKISFVITLILILCLSACSSSNQEYLLGMQSTTIDGYSCTYKQAFDSFFGSPEWEIFISEDDQKVIEFNGQCTYYDELADVCMQFVITSEYDDGTFEFEYAYFDINGTSMPIYEMQSLIDQAASEY